MIREVMTGQVGQRLTTTDADLQFRFWKIVGTEVEIHSTAFAARR